MNCPNCKSRDLSINSSFTTKAEAVGESSPTTVVVEVLSCGSCDLQFPSVRGARKYTLVSSASLGKLQKERRDYEEEKVSIIGRLEEMERKRLELGEEVERVKMKSEIDLLRERIEFAESDVTGLKARRTELNEALCAIDARGGQTLQSPFS